MKITISFPKGGAYESDIDGVLAMTIITQIEDLHKLYPHKEEV